MTGAAEPKNFTHVIDIMRKRSCLTPPHKSVSIKESELAGEFGMSRTPIRQALQTLAREHIVSIRPNVGAQIDALPPGSKAGSIKVYSDFAAVAAGSKPLPIEVPMEFGAIVALLEAGPDFNEELYVALAVKAQNAIVSIIDDPIVADALLAAFWRLLRWRVSDFHHDPSSHWTLFHGNMKKLATAASTQDAGTFLGALLNRTEELYSFSTQSSLK